MAFPHRTQAGFISAVVLSFVALMSMPQSAFAASWSVSHTCSDTKTIPDPPSAVVVGDTITFTAGDGADCHHFLIDKSLIDATSTSNVNLSVSLTFDNSSGRTDPSTWSWSEVNVVGVNEYWYVNFPSHYLKQVDITVGGTAAGTIVLGRDQMTSPTYKATWEVNGSGSGSSGGSSGSSGSSNTGCEVAGKPCRVRPWPWPVAHTDRINVSWEALIPAEAGTGGVTSYRVESTPAGGSCILRLSEVPAGESLPTNCDITGLDPDTDYTFTVYASSHAGEGPGRSTQEAVRMLAAAAPAVATPVVAAPTLPVTGSQQAVVNFAIALLGLGGIVLLYSRRQRDINRLT